MGPQTSASTQCIRWEKLDKMLQDGEVTLSLFYTHRSWGSNRSSRSKVRKPKKSWLETSIWTSYFLHWTRRWALALDTLKLGLASHKAWPRVSHGSTELGKVHGQSWPRKAPDNTQNQQRPHLRALVLGALPDGKQCVDSSWHVDWRWFWQPRAAGFPWAKACWAQFTREAIANGQGDLAFHPCSFNPLCAGMFHCRDSRTCRDRRWCQRGEGVVKKQPCGIQGVCYREGRVRFNHGLTVSPRTNHLPSWENFLNFQMMRKDWKYI